MTKSPALPLTIEDVIRSLKLRHQSVPQPEGKEVAAAYSSGLLPDEATMLHVIAVLLAEARRAVPETS